jgi:hypothetical protein
MWGNNGQYINMPNLNLFMDPNTYKHPGVNNYSINSQ